MLKVFIADDEYYFRQTLIKSIDWESLGFELSGEAKDGLEALTKIEELKPHIILMDINMPIMSGLEVMQLLKESDFKCKIVVITGYDEFNYALQAIQLGVHSFILKPVDKKELTTALLEIKDLFEKEQDNLMEIDKLKKAFTQNLPYLRNQLLYSLIYGNNTLGESALIEKFDYLGIDFVSNKIIVVVFEIDSNNLDWKEREKSIHEHAVLEIIDKILLNDIRGGSCFDNEGRICALLGFNEENDVGITAKVIPRLYRIKEMVKKNFDFTISIGVGCIYNMVDKISLSYNEAINALSNKIILGNDNIIRFNAISNNKLSIFYFTTEHRHKLLIAMRLSDIEECRQILNKIFSSIKGSCKSTVLLKITCINIISTCIEFLTEFKIKVDVNNNPEFDFNEAFAKIQSIEDIDNMQLYIEKFVTDSINEAVEKKKNTSSKFVKQAIDYIHDNISSTDLNLGEIAKSIYVDYSYLCFLFKRETGMTINNYITHIRMKKAKKLMEKGYEYITDISKKVGYLNANYFGKCFKKQYGLSPINYIEKIKQ